MDGQKALPGPEIKGLDADALLRALAAGDLSGLSPVQRGAYYIEACRRRGWDYMLRPFDLISSKGKIVLYPNKVAAALVEKEQGIVTELTGGDYDWAVGIYTARARGTHPDGRTTVQTGRVAVCGLDEQGNLRRFPPSEIANAVKIAETQALRRCVFWLSGLAMADADSELRGGVGGVTVETPTVGMLKAVDRGAIENDPPAPALATSENTDEPPPGLIATWRQEAGMLYRDLKRAGIHAPPAANVKSTADLKAYLTELKRLQAEYLQRRGGIEDTSF